VSQLNQNKLKLVLRLNKLSQLWKERAHKISDVLLLELEKDIKGRKETLLFFLCFLLETRVKATSSASGTSIVISILGKDVRTRLEP